MAKKKTDAVANRYEFDNQLDYILMNAESSVQALHMVMLEVWKMNSDLLKMHTHEESEDVPPGFRQLFGGPPSRPVEITDEKKVYEAIKRMPFEECLAFLKSIRTIRNLK